MNSTQLIYFINSSHLKEQGIEFTLKKLDNGRYEAKLTKDKEVVLIQSAVCVNEDAKVSFIKSFIGCIIQGIVYGIIKNSK